MKITRVNQRIFGSGAPANEIGKFGSLAEGNPETTTDPTAIQELQSFLDGWYAAVIGNNSPAIEDMNSLFYLAFRQIAYILQQGIPEWNSVTDYHQGSWSSDSNGNIYFSKINDNVNNILTDTASWAPLADSIITSKGHLLTSDGSKSISLAPGSNGQILVADSDKANGVKWGIDPLTLLAASNWTYESGDPAGNKAWEDVTYGNGIFVAVGSSSGGTAAEMIMRSYDGKKWSLETNPITDFVATAVTYGNGVFVAVSDLMEGAISSVDGETWVDRSAGDPSAGAWLAVTYGGGLFVAVGRGDVMTSPDGEVWTERVPAGADEWVGVAYGNGVYVAVSNFDAGSNPGNIMWSADGINWNIDTAVNRGIWQSVAFGNGVFVAARSDGEIAYSTDGENWTLGNNAGIAPIRSIVYGGGIFIGVSSLGSGDNVTYSRDGKNWGVITTPASSSVGLDAKSVLRGVTYGKGKFVAVSDLSETGEDVITSLSMPES